MVMSILRIIFVIAVVWLVFIVYRRLRIKLFPLRAASNTGNIKKMVRCALCDLYIPLDDAVISDGTYYCCHQHQAEMNRDQQQ